MTRPDIYFPILLGCFALLCLGAGLVVFEYPPLVMRLPIFAGLFTVAMCLTIVVRVLKTGATSSLSVPVDKTRLLVLTSILPIAYLLGYGWGLPTFLALYLAYNGLSWPRCLVAALVCALLIETVFVRLLKVSLPTLWSI